MRGRKKSCECDGTWNCFECPYPDCRIESSYATRGNIRQDISDALGEESTAKQDNKKARDAAYYQKNKTELLDRQKELVKRNREKYKSVQAVIRDARKKRGWTQSELAGRCGVEARTVSAWESGSTPAKWDRIYAAMPELKEG